MLGLYLAILGGLAVLLGLGSRVLREVPLSEPLVALAAGVVFGPSLLDVVSLPEAHSEQILATAAELAIAFAVMATTLRFTLRQIRERLAALVLLLTVGLVTMAGVSGLMAAACLGIPAASAVLAGAVMAPTDPVLASNAVSGPPAEHDLRLRVRLLLSVESAGNDGLASLLVAVGIAMVAGYGQATEISLAVIEVLTGAVTGGAGGWIAGRLVIAAERHREMEHSAFLVLTLSLTVFVLGAAEIVGGSAIVAVFVAGLTYNQQISDAERREEWEIQEATNRYLVLPVFVLFGLALPWDAWRELGWRGPLLAGGVLLLRRLPFLLVSGRALGLSRTEAAFTGWFGPVGVATLYYLVTALEEGAVEQAVWAGGTLVVAASTLFHGVTAATGRRALARHT